jgi:hypothetical protein
MRRYELRFITADGRKIRGPVFAKKHWNKVSQSIENANDFVVFRMLFGRHKIIIPQAMLEKGHFHIKPVGLLYYAFRLWRAW